MADDSLSQSVPVENPPQSNEIPNQYKEIFYLGCVMCQLIDELWENITVIDNSKDNSGVLFIGSQRCYDVITSLIKSKKRWQETAKQMVIHNI